MLSLLYVSHIRAPSSDRFSTLVDIQSASIARNSRLDITGLLVAAPCHFAQLLEGPPENVDSVMTDILADKRHENIRIIRRKMIDYRRCGSWRMVRFESSSFAATHIEPVLSDTYETEDVEAVRRLEQLFDRLLANQPLTGDIAVR